MKKKFNWNNKRVLITGSCGTIGKALSSEIIKKPIKKLILLDNNETSIYEISEHYSLNKKVQAFLGDIRQKKSIHKAFRDIDIVFHAAALKHVELGELNPSEIISTNILGTENVVECALTNKIQKLIFMSSDKAVNPTNLMGASKLFGEKISKSFNYANSKTILITTRFGNVLGSSGSALIKFIRQIKNNLPVTLTSKRMTRFIMTKKDAVNLLLESCEKGSSGDTFVSKMSAVSIYDLILALYDLIEITKKKKIKRNIKLIGEKKGEKYFEELINNEEIERVDDSKKKYFIVKDKIHSGSKNNDNYSSKSQKLLSVSEIISVLKKDEYVNDLLNIS